MGGAKVQGTSNRPLDEKLRSQPVRGTDVKGCVNVKGAETWMSMAATFSNKYNHHQTWVDVVEGRDKESNGRSVGPIL